MNSHQLICFCSGLLISLQASAQPTQEQIFELNNSIVQVIVDLNHGRTGSGSGVVVNKNYVATNCHVLANAHGVTINKLQNNYAPIAMKADWKHDICLLKFDELPFKSIPLAESPSLQYGQEIFSISYPNDIQVPQTSFGNIRAIYPYDGTVVIRTNAAFSLGSSGGALFDQGMNLIGITTFKSPGRRGYFYSLPSDIINKLFDSPDVLSLIDDTPPFWSYADQDRPYFMRVVIPLQNEEWDTLKTIAQAWVKDEPGNADAWFYLGVAEYNLKEPLASEHVVKSTQLNARHLEALIYLTRMNIELGNKPVAERYLAQVRAIDPDEADGLSPLFEAAS